MHLSTTFLFSLLPALILAKDQEPLKEKAAGWLDKAKAYVSNAAPEIPNPIDAGASKVAEMKVEKINLRNYQRKLGPKPDTEEEWMIYLTGGNKTCYGRCGKIDLLWNESVPLLAALDTFSGSKLRLGRVNCDVEEVLCTALGAAVPSCFHFIFPQMPAGSTSTPLSPMRDIALNISNTNVEHITSIPRASKSRYLDYPEYTGPFHPVDGWLRKFGLLNAVGYTLWGFGSTPSWLFMIAVSFFSRQIMARRAAARVPGMNQMQQQVGSQQPAAGARAATGASPAGAKGGAKKRK